MATHINLKVELDIDVELVGTYTMEDALVYAKSIEVKDVVKLKNQRHTYNDFNVNVTGVSQW